MRIRFVLLVVAVYTLLASAHAGTITVTFTSASAFAISCNHVSTFAATCSDSNSAGSGEASADVLAGHAGAAVGVNSAGFVGALAMFTVAMNLQDFTDTDYLEVDMSLQGSFRNGGANASLQVDDGNSVFTYGISCGDGIVFLFNRKCNPASGTEQAIIPLANLDTLGLTFLLQPGVTEAPGFADFLNSFDSTIKVPNGTVIVNGPGGSLFQPQSAPAVPEPASLLLMGAGLAGIVSRRRRAIEPQS